MSDPFVFGMDESLHRRVEQLRSSMPPPVSILRFDAIRPLFSVGVSVRFHPWMMPRSTDAFFCDGYAYFYSETALAYAIAGVRWHDGPGHCPTWAAACSCDVEVFS